MGKRAELCDTPKRREAKRAEWSETEVKKRAQAARDENWEKNLTEMTRVAEERITNGKLTAVANEIDDGALNRI